MQKCQECISFLSALINQNPSCPRCPWKVCRITNETCFIWNITVTTSRFKLSYFDKKAMFFSAVASHSGDWLLALPVTSCWLRLTDEAVRVAVSRNSQTSVPAVLGDATAEKRGLLTRVIND